MFALRTYAALEAVVGRERLWRIGRWLYLGSRRELRNNPAVNGEYALQEWLAAGEVCGSSRDAHVFVDIGANIGSWSKNLLEVLRRAGVEDFVVHCCEPSPGQFETLSERLKPLARGRVRFDSRGVAAVAGKASFSITGDHSGNGSINPKSNATNVTQIEVTTVDNIFAESSYPCADLIKIDTEGNDLNVIMGATSLIQSGSISVIQFEYNWRWIAFRHTLKDVFDFIASMPYVLGKLTSDKIEFYLDWHPELERFIETNYVLVHRDVVGRLPHVFMTFDNSNVAVHGEGAEAFRSTATQA